LHDQVEEHAHAAAVGLEQELSEVAARPEPSVDPVVVGDVVAVVAVRRRIHGCEPKRIDAEALEVVEPITKTSEVANAVPVSVHERLDREAVDDSVAIPGLHGGGYSLRRPRTHLMPSFTQPRGAGRGPEPNSTLR
jgi:hypothetical protein